MGSAFHQLCPRYSGTLTPTAPTAIRLWETFTFNFLIVGSFCTAKAPDIFGGKKKMADFLGIKV